MPREVEAAAENFNGQGMLDLVHDLITPLIWFLEMTIFLAPSFDGHFLNKGQVPDVSFWF